MRGAWLTLLLAACGGAPAPVVAAAQPAPPAAPPVAALQAGSPWVLSAGAVALGEPTYRWMHFTPNGALIATGPLGVVSLEPNGPGETLLRPLPTGAELYDMTYAGRWALLQWAEIVEGVRKLHIDVLDVDTGARLATPEDDEQPSAALSNDGALLAWIASRDGHGFVYDTVTRTQKMSLPAAGELPVSAAPRFSANGRYLFAHGVLFDIEAQRQVLERDTSRWFLGFVRGGGQDRLVLASGSRLQWHELDTGKVREADVDCLNGSGYRDSINESLGVYARICSRGVLYTDLRTLAQYEGKKPLAPVRVKDGFVYAAVGDRLLVGLRTTSREREVTWDIASRWVSHDPRTGIGTKITQAPPNVLQAAGAVSLERDEPSQRCTLRGVPALAGQDVPCESRLSAEGTMLAKTDKGTLSVLALPTLQPLHSIGDSALRGDERLDFALEVDESALRVHATMGFDRENDFTLARTVVSQRSDFTGGDDDLEERSESERVQLLAAIPALARTACKHSGVLANGTIGLIHCQGYGTEAFQRYDMRTAKPIGAPRVVVGVSNSSIGAVDGVAFDRLLSTTTLARVLVRDEASQEPQLLVHIGWDFAIVEDELGHVQLFGNRKRASSWLRCRVSANALEPFERCANTEGTLF